MNAHPSDPVSQDDCLCCGACCRTFPIFVSSRDVAREPRIAECGLKLKPWLETESRSYQLYPLPFLEACPFLDAQQCCRVYATRPEVCRRFQPGEEQCLQARRRKGVGAVESPHRPPIVECENAAFLFEGRSLCEGTTLCLRRGDCLVLRGRRASRRLFLQGLLGRLPLARGALRFYAPDGVSTSSVLRDHTLSRREVGFLRDEPAIASIYGEALPLQARWNSVYRSLSPSVRAFLEFVPGQESSSSAQAAFDLLDLAALLDRPLLSLSKGETRRVVLARAAAEEHRLLLLEEPFTGLDAHYRERVLELFRILRERAALVLSLSGESFVVAPDQRELWIDRDAEESDLSIQPQCGQAPVSLDQPCNEVLVELSHVTVAYGEVTVLRDLTWCAHAGERWILAGANGSGKSSLVSLIAGDNPQLYVNDVRLAGLRLGTGMRLEEWRARVGYAAPELLRRISRSLSVRDVIATGFTQTPSVVRRVTPEQYRAIDADLSALAPEISPDMMFGRLSRAAQLRVLLVRAVVHRPEVLLLDELEDGLTAEQYAGLLGSIGRAADLVPVVLMATHAVAQAAPYFSRELRLDAGSIVRFSEDRAD